MSIPFVYWKMVACRNVTPPPKFRPTIKTDSLYLQAVILDYTKRDIKL